MYNTYREASPEDEFVICTIKVDSNGVLSIKPDFNKGCRAYKIEAPGMGRGEVWLQGFYYDNYLGELR